MKFSTVLKAFFIICLCFFIADIFIGKMQFPVIVHNNIKVSDLPIKQQAKELFSNIELYLQTPINLPKLQFLTTKGTNINLNELSGRLVLLNAWATWCAPCVKELPSLQEAKNILQHEGWQVMAVSVDYDTEIEKINAFVKSHNVEDVAGFLDTSGEFQEMIMQVGGVPVTYILSAKGNILARINGSVEWNHPEVIDFLRNLAASQ